MTITAFTTFSSPLRTLAGLPPHSTHDVPLATNQLLTRRRHRSCRVQSSSKQAHSQPGTGGHEHLLAHWDCKHAVAVVAAFLCVTSMEISPVQAALPQTPPISQVQQDKQDKEATKEYFKKELAEVTRLQQKAFDLTNQGRLEEADQVWTDIIKQRPDVAGAWSNRGNGRTSQGLFQEALRDFDKAIELAPEEADPYIGRGIAREGLRQFQEAIQDYDIANSKTLKRAGREDAVAYNNRGNAEAGLQQWDKAIEDYHKAQTMEKEYVFPRASESLILWQIGDKDSAMRTMRGLTRKYPNFSDMHAALAAAYWDTGRPALAESEWGVALSQDPRYKDLDWVSSIRRWPPSMVDALDRFLRLQAPRP